MKYLILLLLLIASTSGFSQETPPPPPPVAIVTTPPPTKTKKPSRKDKLMDFPDVLSDFKGGTVEMQKFIAENVSYPQEAINNLTQGRVYLSFIVKKNGKITNIEVERGVDPLLDREAKRLISIMPKWVPAKHEGKKVNSVCRLPINFTLN